MNLAKKNVFSVTFWLLFSIYVVFESYHMGLGTWRMPGPGFLPFGASILLAIISLSVLLNTPHGLLERGSVGAGWRRRTAELSEPCPGPNGVTGLHLHDSTPRLCCEHLPSDGLFRLDDRSKELARVNHCWPLHNSGILSSVPGCARCPVSDGRPRIDSLDVFRELGWKTCNIYFMASVWQSRPRTSSTVSWGFSSAP